MQTSPIKACYDESIGNLPILTNLAESQIKQKHPNSE